MKRLITICVFLYSCGVFASDPFANYMGGAAPMGSSLTYSFEDSPQSGTPSTPGVLENRLRGNWVVSRSEKDTYSLQGTFADLHFGNPPTFTNTGVILPQNLWNVDGGMSYRHSLENKRELGASVSVGSASDIPFYGINETEFQVNGTYKVPTDDYRGWIYLINWSNNRSFLNFVPLPGVEYYYRSKDSRINLIAGFPFAMVSDEFYPSWTAKASFAGISQASAEVSKKVAQPLSVYTGFDWGQRIWLRVNRDDNSNRLFFDQKKLSVGLRSDLTARLFADLSGGYEFARQVFEAHSYTSTKEGQADINSAWGVFLSLGLKEFSPPKLETK